MIAAPLFHSWGFAHFTLAMGLTSTVVLRRKFDPEGDAVADRAAPRAPRSIVVPGDAAADPRARRRDPRPLRPLGAAAVPVSGSALPPAISNALDGPVRREPLQPLRLDRGRVGDDRHAGGPARRARHGRPPAARHRREAVRRRRRPGRPRAARGGSSSATSCAFEGYTGGGSKDAIDGLLSLRRRRPLRRGRPPVRRRPRRRHDRLGRRERASRARSRTCSPATTRSSRWPCSASTDDQFGQRLRGRRRAARGRAR